LENVGPAYPLAEVIVSIPAMATTRFMSESPGLDLFVDHYTGKDADSHPFFGSVPPAERDRLVRRQEALDQDAPHDRQAVQFVVDLQQLGALWPAEVGAAGLARHGGETHVAHGAHGR